MFVTILVCTAVNAVILSIMFVYFRKKVTRAVSSAELIETVRREVDELIVEMNHTTDRNIALLEERIGYLNRLLKEADSRIVVLRRQLERPTEKTTYEDILIPSRQAAREKPKEEPTTRERVLAMAGEGFDNAVIAGKLGLPLGEVDLIVSLESSRSREEE